MKLSIVILNYNTKELLDKCLGSLERAMEKKWEVIVVDNGSTDGSWDMVLRKYSFARTIKNEANIGFAAGNNLARTSVRGEYVLFLNSDTEVSKATLPAVLAYMDKHREVGAITCKVLLPNGRLDRDTRRSFPTPWVAFTHFSGLDKVFPKSRVLSKYWYGHVSSDAEHDVDVIQGAFFFVRKEVLDKVGWFDEDYFLDGEDIDLCWKIHKAGMRIVYYPKVSIIHHKGATKGKNRKLRKNNKKERMRYVTTGVNSMSIFYRKHFWNRYNVVLNYSVMFGIGVIKLIRYIKVILT